MSRDLFANEAVAHSALKGEVGATRFTDGVLLRVAVPVADLRAAPGATRLERQILYGHPVRQLEATDGFSRDETSRYVGYVPPVDLAPWIEPTHRVAVRATLLFHAPDIKSPAPLAVSCGALLAVEEIDGRFARTACGHFAIAAHLVPERTANPDLAATAETLLGTPYLWGGNSAAGIDCSGLVQLAAQAAWLPCPGDSDQQLAALGVKLPDGTEPRRNDLMFWKGHVAIVSDVDTLIHANAYHMAVAFEPLEQALRRIDEQGDGPRLAHKRIA